MRIYQLSAQNSSLHKVPAAGTDFTEQWSTRIITHRWTSSLVCSSSPLPTSFMFQIGYPSMWTGNLLLGCTIKPPILSTIDSCLQNSDQSSTHLHELPHSCQCSFLHHTQLTKSTSCCHYSKSQTQLHSICLSVFKKGTRVPMTPILQVLPNG